MKNKDLDKILKPLGDFDPQAKPDWGAFIAENESRINTEGKIPGNDAGKGILNNKVIRFAGGLMVAATALLLAWYFMGSPMDLTQPADNQTPQKTEITKDRPDEAEIPVVKSVEDDPVTLTDPAGEILNTEVKAPVDPVNNEPATTKAKTANPGTTAEDKGKAESQKSEQDKTVIITDTVFMKKTIYITDTVKRK